MTKETMLGMARKMEKIPSIKTMQTKKEWSKLKPSLFTQLTTRTWPRPDGKANRIKRLFKSVLARVGIK